MTEDQIRRLDGVDLELVFAKACDFLLAGSKAGPFGLINKDCGDLIIFGTNEQSVTYASFSSNYASVVLEQGHKRHAVLSSNGKDVDCKIEDAEASGDSYTQALMRTIILHSMKRGKKISLSLQSD